MLVIGDLYMAKLPIYGGLESDGLNSMTRVNDQNPLRAITTISVKPNQDIILNLGAYAHDVMGSQVYKRRRFYHFRYKACVWLWEEDEDYLIPFTQELL